MLNRICGRMDVMNHGSDDIVKIICLLISQFYHMQAGTTLVAANDNSEEFEGGDDDSVA